MMACRRLLGVLLLCLSGAACDSRKIDLAPHPHAFLLDGMFLAPGASPGQGYLLCGRFEITRGEYAVQEVSANEQDLPVVFVTMKEAQDWARDRGLRLPTVYEWRHLALVGGAGTGRRYPWGSAFRQSTANTLELGINAPLKVGVFERGRSPLGAYDFCGNVWEWATGLPGVPGPAAEFDVQTDQAWVCGGSYASRATSATVDSVRPMHPLDRASDVGFRCVTEAESWLVEFVVPIWQQARQVDRQTIVHAFERWRSDLRRELAERLRDQVPEDFYQALVRGEIL